MIVTFCGHREVQDPERVWKWLYVTIEGLIGEGADCFYLGGYGQFDSMAAGVVRELKMKYPQIRSVLVLPYFDREYDASGYDESIYPPLENVPRRYAISKRNEYMVDKVDVVVAYVIYGFGGASKTLRYAERKNKRIIRYNN
ncbi:MAG: hypothetical protein IKZ82_07190 [Clostridia bacterium]|nr:hypothetical protein [Clostridia bacterium]